MLKKLFFYCTVIYSGLALCQTTNLNPIINLFEEDCSKLPIEKKTKYRNASIEAMLSTYSVDSYFTENKLNLVIEKVSFNKNSEQDFLQEMNNYIEKKIREYPHEYLWQHRRFKSTLGKDKLYK